MILSNLIKVAAFTNIKINISNENNLIELKRRGVTQENQYYDNTRISQIKVKTTHVCFMLAIKIHEIVQH